jgi:hypothetical protein
MTSANSWPNLSSSCSVKVLPFAFAFESSSPFHCTNSASSPTSPQQGQDDIARRMELGPVSSLGKLGNFVGETGKALDKQDALFLTILLILMGVIYHVIERRLICLDASTACTCQLCPEKYVIMNDRTDDDRGELRMITK